MPLLTLILLLLASNLHSGSGGQPVHSRAESQAFVATIRANVGIIRQGATATAASTTAGLANTAAFPSVTHSNDHSANVHVSSFAGADPTGTTDSTAAIQQAIDTAWASVPNPSQWPQKDGAPGPDLAGRAVDFDGGHYRVSHPLRIPSIGGCNVVFANGALHATAAFPRSRWLVEMGNVTGLPPAPRPAKHQSITSLSLFQNGATSGFEMGCAPSTSCSGSQPKHVRLWFGAAGPNQNTPRIQHIKRSLIIKPCPLAAQICCTFSTTSFSSVQFNRI